MTNAYLEIYNYTYLSQIVDNSASLAFEHKQDSGNF